MKKAVVEKIAQVDFAGVVADELNLAINDFIEEKGFCTVVLAGGKTPSSIYRSLSVPPRRDEIDWKKVKLFLDDERFVPFESDQNNFKMISETLISKLPQQPEIVKIDTDNTLITKEPLRRPSYVIKFTKDEKSWFTIRNSNVVCPFKKENKPVIAMRPYLDEVFNQENRNNIIELFDTRSLKFRNLITFKRFQNELQLLKPRNIG